MKTTYLTIFTVVLLISLQMSCSTGKPLSLSTKNNSAVALTQPAKEVAVTTEAVNMADPVTISDPNSEPTDGPITFPEIEFTPPYDIMETSFTERGDKAESLFLLIPTVDLSQRKYVSYIKNIIKKLIVYSGYSETISILIFDDQTSLDLIFKNPVDPNLNIPSHFIARYDGHKKGLTYDYNLVIFPLAPKSNSYVKNHHEVIRFNPFNW